MKLPMRALAVAMASLEMAIFLPPAVANPAFDVTSKGPGPEADFSSAGAALGGNMTLPMRALAVAMASLEMVIFLPPAVANPTLDVTSKGPGPVADFSSAGAALGGNMTFPMITFAWAIASLEMVIFFPPAVANPTLGVSSGTTLGKEKASPTNALTMDSSPAVEKIDCDVNTQAAEPSAGLIRWDAVGQSPKKDSAFAIASLETPKFVSLAVLKPITEGASAETESAFWCLLSTLSSPRRALALAMASSEILTSFSGPTVQVLSPPGPPMSWRGLGVASAEFMSPSKAFALEMASSEILMR